MPIIVPPPDGVIYEDATSEAPRNNQREWERYRRITLFINVNNWICPSCSSTVFGRCKECPYCKHKLGRITSRPVNFKLRRTDV